MIDIYAIRGEGDNPGEDISNSLLCTVSAAVERGRVEIDASAINSVDEVQTTSKPGIRPGALVMVMDSLMGESWKGRIVSCEKAVEGVHHYSRAVIERVV